YKKEHRNEILYCFFEQYIARKQWDALKKYANSKGISIIGALPFYTGLDSADVWAAPELFQIDGSFRPTALPAVPPGPLAKEGHVLKNPLYQWNAMLKSNFLWWRRRFMDSLQQFDVVYIDWLREIESSYIVPAGSQSAKKGRTVKGPGAEFTTAIHHAFPSAKVIADVSGCDAAQEKALLERSGYTGTRVVQCSFNSAYPCTELPYNYEQDVVVYTSLDGSGAGTWPSSVSAADKQAAAAYLAVNKQNGWSAAFARAALTSAPDTAIVPMSDYLDFDDEGGAERKSGGKSASTGQLSLKVLNTKLADKIRFLAAVSGRLAKK
ncbi:MAG: 4-alpha-glucanotransferase, partial [Spirochaetaceae bacterium]|nr:4-alpha-glucanotransferase [Spirochaetaceae bacterium]